MLPDLNRLGLDLWPNKRKLRIKEALAAKDGQHIHITNGEAETIVRNETERAINVRLQTNDPGRPKQISRPNCWLDWT
jgi:hypothetical protein